MSITRFEWYTKEEAARKLAEIGEPTADNHADRIRLQRRAELEVSTPAERAAVRAFNARRARPHAKTGKARTPAKGRDARIQPSAKTSRKRRGV